MSHSIRLEVDLLVSFWSFGDEQAGAELPGIEDEPVNGNMSSLDFPRGPQILGKL